MDVVMIGLRLLHILGGVFWVGSSLMLGGFLTPAIQASGPAGGQVMQRLMTGTRYGSVVGLSGLVTMLAGLLLYFRVSGGLQPAWITTATGLTLTLGGVAGIAAGAIGGGVAGRTAQKIGQLNAAIGNSPGTPGEAQLVELRTLQQRMKQAQLWSIALMIVAVAAMAVARYL